MRAGQRGARRGITALALSAGLVTTGTITGTTAVAHAGEQSSGQGDRSVTLITGDRVELAGDRVVRVVPGPGRGRLPVRTFTRDGHQHVVPADAIALVDSGKLDPRLFDVTSLAEFGYDDSRRNTVPVIVRPAAGARSGITALAAKGSVNGTGDRHGREVGQRLGVAARRRGREGVARRRPQGDARPQHQADRRAGGVAGRCHRQGREGRGARHGRRREAPGPAGQADRREELHRRRRTTPTRSGTARTSRRRSPARASQYRGVAPDAEILDGKVCQPGGCQRVGDPRRHAVGGRPGRRASVNMSLGGRDTPGDRPDRGGRQPDLRRRPARCS